MYPSSTTPTTVPDASALSSIATASCSVGSIRLPSASIGRTRKRSNASVSRRRVASTPPRGAPPRRSPQARAAGCRRRPRARTQNPRPRTAASRHRRAITPENNSLAVEHEQRAFANAVLLPIGEPSPRRTDFGDRPAGRIAGRKTFPQDLVDLLVQGFDRFTIGPRKPAMRAAHAPAQSHWFHAAPPLHEAPHVVREAKAPGARSGRRRADALSSRT